jgi:hypothetical protein
LGDDFWFRHKTGSPEHSETGFAVLLDPDIEIKYGSDTRFGALAVAGEQQICGSVDVCAAMVLMREPAEV